MFLLASLVFAVGAWWLQHPLTLDKKVVEVTIEPGARARAVVQEKFSAISPTAQVQLLHTPGRESSVDLISGVATPGTFPLPDRDVTVLGLIAMGGGISKDLINPQVRLSRLRIRAVALEAGVRKQRLNIAGEAQGSRGRSGLFCARSLRIDSQAGNEKGN